MSVARVPVFDLTGVNKWIGLLYMLLTYKKSFMSPKVVSVHLTLLKC